MKEVPFFRLARAMAHSPSSCDSLASPAGELKKGTEYRWPKMVVPVSTSLTPTSTRGRNRILRYQSMLAARVRQSLAAPDMYAHDLADRYLRAASSKS